MPNMTIAILIVLIMILIVESLSFGMLCILVNDRTKTDA